MPVTGVGTGARGHATPVSTARRRLEERYAALVRRELPARAREQGWVLRHDHCFGRVLLDDAVGGCWYDVLDRRRTGFRQLDDVRLGRCCRVGRAAARRGRPAAA